ncbi:MAG: hypothetical protein ACLT98_08220 [Eggerthellaceae bacterium]
MGTSRIWCMHRSILKNMLETLNNVETADQASALLLPPPWCRSLAMSDGNHHAPESVRVVGGASELIQP